MGQYVPGTQDPELARISQALSSPNDTALLNVLYKAPAKTKPGALVVADGTSWNPGSGAGLYLRNAANNAWLFVPGLLLALANTWTAKQTIANDLEFSGTGRRLTADFSNATFANRLTLQSSTVNGFTLIPVAPNGTSTGAGIFFANSSGLTNFSFLLTDITNTDARIFSGQIGTGTYLPFSYYVGGSMRMQITTAGVVNPGADNTQNFGSAGSRWKELFAGNGTINISDAREKTAVSALTASEIAAAKQLAKEIGSYQFLNAIAAKGQYVARHHIGMTTQRAIEIMRANGLDPMRYGFICYDKWEAQTEEVLSETGAFIRMVKRQATVRTERVKRGIEIVDGVPIRRTVTEVVNEPAFIDVTVVDEDGTPVVPALTHPVPVMEEVAERYDLSTRPAGDRYGFRMDELLAFIAAGFDARLSALESPIS